MANTAGHNSQHSLYQNSYGQTVEEVLFNYRFDSRKRKGIQNTEKKWLFVHLDLKERKWLDNGEK